MITHILAGTIAVFTIAALAIPDPPRADPTLSGYVRVIDGDTIAFRDARVRLWGIDAPEMSTPGGPLARAHLKRIINDGVVTCHPRGGDPHRRIVAKCFVMDRDLSATMVLDGHARDVPYYSRGYYHPDAIKARAAQKTR